jgi:hypothetical protein
MLSDELPRGRVVRDSAMSYSAVLIVSREGRYMALPNSQRRTRQPRPLSAKTVRNIAGVLSSACARHQMGTADGKPSSAKRASGASTTARNRSHARTAETADRVGERLLVFEAILGSVCRDWGPPRRSVGSALWSDFQSGAVSISRSLSQTKTGLAFKETKKRSARLVVLPDSAVRSLSAHREAQGAFRNQFGPDHRSDLDLISAEPEAIPSSRIQFRRPYRRCSADSKYPSLREPVCTCCGTRMDRTFWPPEWNSRPSPNGSPTALFW